MIKDQFPEIMKKLNKWQNVLFVIGACLMVAGVGMYVFGTSDAACWVFAAGVAAFCSMQSVQTYDGGNLTIRLLRRIMLVGDVFFVLSALLIIENTYHWLYPYFVRNGIEWANAYIQYIYNNWVVTLLVASIIELYTTHRISRELGKV